MISWQKKGEWLELRLPRPIQNENDMKEYIRLPDKFLGNLIKAQGVSLAGARARLKLFPNEPLQTIPRWFPLEVLFEDDFCLVVLKPAGMKLHTDGTRSDAEPVTLSEAVAGYYESTGQACRPRHIHRLDEDTTGPVLFAKHEWGQLILDEAMREKKIGREYCAIVQGRLKQQHGTIDAPIGKDRHHASRRRVSPTGDRAVTHYQVAEQWKDAALVRLKLETGRTHQIRVHLSYLGHPIWGDALYGGRKEGIDRQALHGEKLVFNHPLTGERTEIEAPWPQDMERLYSFLQKI
ncbi:RluA family pseudouridine synthase [Paenibacillus rigui]|uniref:Pseudouridine synthase n=1 Tax=Paenibacillus rigui TaxID=554312 RepID=A0A229UU18_9BACL|nr:RluA family pseudouridine synthase [Paenibacillus rigui]OXM86870.1 RNA pseudouridine synthase [Paenibacillus rigui]